MNVRMRRCVAGFAFSILLPMVGATADAGNKVCSLPDSGSHRCLYQDSKNEDGVRCIVGTDDTDNRTKGGYDYCLTSEHVA